MIATRSFWLPGNSHAAAEKGDSTHLMVNFVTVNAITVQKI